MRKDERHRIEGYLPTNWFRARLDGLARVHYAKEICGRRENVCSHVERHGDTGCARRFIGVACATTKPPTITSVLGEAAKELAESFRR